MTETTDPIDAAIRELVMLNDINDHISMRVILSRIVEPRFRGLKMPRNETPLSDDEMARDDPNLCKHGWSRLHPQPCPECPSAEEQAEEIVARAEAAHQQYGGSCGTEFCPILRAEIVRKIALSRCAAELGYGGNRPYSAMIEYIAEAIAQARQEGEASAEARTTWQDAAGTTRQNDL